MKKLVFLLVCLFTLQTVARADDDKPIQVTQMPQLAQQFIKQHFSDSKVALAKMESDFLYKSYEVIFTNGNKVEFDKKGNWEEVDCKHTSVPVSYTHLTSVEVAIPSVKDFFRIRTSSSLSSMVAFNAFTLS